MSDTSRPAIGPNALPSELLKGIVGGAHHDDKQNVDSNTAIEMTAGADEAGHNASGQATAPASQPPAVDAKSTAAAETVDDVGKLANQLQGQLQEQASPKTNEILKVVTDQQQRHQPALDQSKTMLEAQQAAQDAAKSAHEAQHEFSEQAETLGAMIQHVATQAAHPDSPHDPDAAEKTLATFRQAAESGDPDAFKAALTDLFGKPAAGQAGIANESGIDSGEQVRESLEAQQKLAETISTPESKPPSDDEIADQINRNVGVDQAAELASASAWHDDEQLKYRELIEKLWALARATGDTFLSNQIKYLVTGHDHNVWRLESDQHAKYLAQTISQAKAILGDISLAREIVGFKATYVKQAEAELERAKATGDASLIRGCENGVSIAKSFLHDAERVLESKIKWRENVLRMHKQAEKEGNASDVRSLKNVRDRMEKLYSEYASKPRPGADNVGHGMPATPQPPAAPVDVGKLADQLQKQASPKLNEILKVVTDQQQRHQQALDQSRTVLETQEAAKSAHEALHEFSEQQQGVPDIIAAPGPVDGPAVKTFHGPTGELVNRFLEHRLDETWSAPDSRDQDAFPTKPAPKRS